MPKQPQTFRFIVRIPPDDYDSINILYTTSLLTEGYTCLATKLPKDTTEYTHEFGDESSLYAYQLVKGEDIVYQSSFRLAQATDQMIVPLNDIFHPVEIRRIGLKPGHVAIAIHQSSSPMDWWMTTKTFYTVVQNDYTIELNNESLFPRAGQEQLEDFQELAIGNLYIVPLQVFDFLQFLSFQIEKSDYTFPETLPKKFAVQELITCLEMALKRFNAYPPITNFCFSFSSSEIGNVALNNVQEFITRFAIIIALRSLVVMWSDLEFEYSDDVSVSIGKKDAYSGELSELEGAWQEELDKIKSKFLPKAGFLGQRGGFAAPKVSPGNRFDSFAAPYLAAIQDVSNARQGIFNQLRRSF